MTLVNRDKTERLTIDTNIRFRNLHTGREQSLPDLVIIELKQDGNRRHLPVSYLSITISTQAGSVNSVSAPC